MWIQSSIKHVLTQGDSLLVAWLTTIQDQGVYALAANYGSLIARMLFQPLEESSRNLFSKLLSAENKNKASVTSAAQILKTITKLYLLLSLFFAVLGPPFAPVALNLVAGKRWGQSAAGDVLACFCYYIPLLAINGITESFVQSVATPQELRRQGAWMFSFSLGFGVAGYAFVRSLAMGAQGLVWANVVNMALRIAWSSVFIRRYFKGCGVIPGWAEVAPSSMLVAVAVAVAAAVRGQGGLPAVAELGLVRQMVMGVSAGGVMVIAW
jgi:oligosaccharide translocation protein RFT1